MNLAKTGKKLGITAVMLTTIGAGIAFGENRASAAVDMNAANDFAQQESSLPKEDLQNLVNAAKQHLDNEADPSQKDTYLSQYYGVYKALYGHFPNEATTSATTTNTGASNNSGVVSNSGTSTNMVTTATANTNKPTTANSEATANNQNNASQVTGVNTTDVTKGTELPQTGNDSSIASTVLGSLMGLFGLGLAAKKRSL